MEFASKMATPLKGKLKSSMKERSLKVLIVEDNPDHAELIENALLGKDENFIIEKCASKNEFLNRIKREKYDALLIDYDLPDGTGLDLLKCMSEKKLTAPAIFVSGTENEEIISKVMKAGASDFVIKSRTSLKTLPILVKKNIIRKITSKDPDPFGFKKPQKIYRHLEESIKKLSKSSIELTQNITKGKFSTDDLDEIILLEKMLDKTNNLLKNIKKKFLKIQSNQRKMPSSSGPRKRSSKSFH